MNDKPGSKPTFWKEKQIYYLHNHYTSNAANHNTKTEEVWFLISLAIKGQRFCFFFIYS